MHSLGFPLLLQTVFLELLRVDRLVRPLLLLRAALAALCAVPAIRTIAPVSAASAAASIAAPAPLLFSLLRLTVAIRSRLLGLPLLLGRTGRPLVGPSLGQRLLARRRGRQRLDLRLPLVVARLLLAARLVAAAIALLIPPAAIAAVALVIPSPVAAAVAPAVAPAPSLAPLAVAMLAAAAVLIVRPLGALRPFGRHAGFVRGSRRIGRFFRLQPTEQAAEEARTHGLLHGRR